MSDSGIACFLTTDNSKPSDYYDGNYRSPYPDLNHVY